MLGAHIVQRLLMRGKLSALSQLEIENGDIQLPLRGDLRVFLPQAARRGIAGIGHQGLALDLQTGVDLLKDSPGHIDLPPDDEPGQLVRQGHRYGTDGAQILRDILAGAAIAAGSALIKHAVSIFQGHGKPVDLGFHAVFGTGQSLPHPFQKLHHLAVIEGILQTLQRHIMVHLGKVAQDLAADALRGTVWRDLLRVFLFQILQLPVQPVILKVGHGGSVQDVIKIAVGVQYLAQLTNLLFVISHNVLPIRCS